MYPPADQQPVQRLPGKDGAYWKKQIDLALSVRNRYETWWDANLKAYAPSVDKDPEAYGLCINTNRDFTLVERKKADLFYQRPDVTLQPTPLMEGPILAGPPDMLGNPTPLLGQPDQQGQQQPIPATVALAAHQEIVNEKLGPDGIDAVAMMDRVLFDVLCPAGLGCTKMGYESVTIPVPQEVQVGSELPPGAVLGLGATTPTMKTVQVPVPIHEHCFWEAFSPKALLIPHDFRSTEFDKAPWLGYQFTLPLTPGTREQFKLHPDFEGNKGAGDRKQHFDHGVAETDGEGTFTGVELFARSSLIRSDRPHPDHLTRIVLVDGANDGEPVIEEDCRYQTLDGRGGLTPDSLIGFPIHIFTIRVLTDSAYPPSDCTMIGPLRNELNKFRDQMVQARDVMITRFAVSTDVPPEAVSKIVRSPFGGIVHLPPELMVGETVFKSLDAGSFPRESFTSNDYIDNDIARTTAIDAAGAGVQSQSSSTATEQQIVAANANARLDKERGLALKAYVRGVTKFSTILLRYLPVAQAAQIVGPGRAQVWEAWRKSKPNSALAFTAMPDSALRVDQAVDRKAFMDAYTYWANEPYIQKGRGKLVEKGLRKFHIDPSDIVSAPDPPKPEPPKLAMSFKGEDLIGPQAPIVLEILKQQGIEISPEAVQQSQGLLLQQEQLMAQQAQAKADTKHGGKVAQMEGLSKHAVDQTGGMQNTGAPAALGAAGGGLQ